MDVVYLITDTITNLKYIGSKKNWKGVGTYFGSPNCRSPRFKKYKIQQEWKAALKTRKDTFVFEILEQYESIEHTKLTERELFWQKKLDVVKSTEYINAGFAKHGFHGNIYEQLSNEEATLIKEKISLSMKLRYETMPIDIRNALSKKFQGQSNGNYGNKWSNMQKMRASIRMKEYFKTNISYKKDKTHIQIFGKEKALEISKKLSKVASERIRDKNPFFGKHHTEASKKKIAESNRGRIPPNTRKVKIDGIIYESLAAASKATNIKIPTIWHRLNSKNTKYITYSYVDDSPAIKAEVAV